MPAQPVLTDTPQSSQQHLKQESLEEFRRFEPHRAGRIAECDVSISDIDQEIVRDGDAMYVTLRVAEYLVWTVKRLLHVHDQFGV